MPRKTNLFLASVLLIVVVFSCDSKLIFDEYQSLPNAWSKDSEVKFKFTAPDTINNYNLFVNLRNNSDYQFSNLYIITGLEYPNGKTIIDTLEYKMAAPNGELLGEGFTDVKENKLWYKGYRAPFKFTEAGIYIFRVQQAMRKYGDVKGVEDLEGITEVGFRIENK